MCWQPWSFVWHSSYSIHSVVIDRQFNSINVAQNHLNKYFNSVSSSSKADTFDIWYKHCRMRQLLYIITETINTLFPVVNFLNVLLQKSSRFQLLLLRHWHFTRSVAYYLATTEITATTRWACHLLRTLRQIPPFALIRPRRTWHRAGWNWSECHRADGSRNIFRAAENRSRCRPELPRSRRRNCRGFPPSHDFPAHNTTC